MAKNLKFELTVIKKEEILNFDKTIYVATLAHPETLEHSEYNVPLGSTKEDFDFYQIGQKYELLIRPAAPVVEKK